MLIKGVGNIIKFSPTAMLSTEANHDYDVQPTSEEQQAKLRKIEELTNMLKDMDKNLTVCEEILTTYLRKRLKVRVETNDKF
ncbi:hypothetical protein M0804_005791 [Polistes exclamans]|nr:hypothetical protein M0804_005791 [Polistes exclamans]